MEYHSRRNRRGRMRARPGLPLQVTRPQKRSVLNDLCNFLLMSCLIIIVYLMFDYQCNVCSKKCDLRNVTRSIYDLSQNISRMKNSYSNLEKTVQKFSSELPKIEGQIEVLETLANTMKRTYYVWNHKKYLSLPNVGVILNKPEKVSLKNPGFDNLTQMTLEPVKVGKD